MSAPARWVLGTRGSALALAQSGIVTRVLDERHEGLAVEQRIVKTDGDIRADAPLGPGDRGVFVKAIEQALLAGEIDFAVHSLKDLPSADTPGLVIAAVPEREDPRDALIASNGASLQDLPQGARVGTGSPRRRGQLLLARPDLSVHALRGNIDTRISRVGQELDAVVLAVAGLKRLGVHQPWSPIDPEVCLLAVGQGALALQAREDDPTTIGRLRVMEHAPTRHQVVAERAFLAELGGGCLAPATAFAQRQSGALRIDAMVAEIDGGGRYVESCTCAVEDGPDRARELAQRLIQRGAQRWIDAARSQASGNA